MRLTFFFLLIAVLQVSAKGYGQITIKVKDAPLNQVLNQIRQQSGYVFLTNQQELGRYKVTAQINNADIKTVMDRVIGTLPLQYKIIDRTIVIKLKPAAGTTAATDGEAPADIEVTGRVLDEKGAILEGSSVWANKGSFTSGTSSDKNGYFILRNIPDDATLHVSRLGFAQVDINLKKAKLPLTVTLTPRMDKLEEVNVTYKTGYQQISKDRATGSFVHIDRELLDRSPSTNLLDRIAYVTSGLVFDRKTTLMANAERQTPYLIRGLSTISGNPHPLIVIDGFPYEETTMEGSSLYFVLNDLNPNDVADVTILRDAAAASIWGAKAGNGVIVITTKKGRFNQQARVEFTTNISIRDKEDLSKLPMMSSADAVEVHKALYNRGTYNPYDASYPASRNFPVLPQAAEVLLAMKKGKLSAAEADAQLAQLASYDTRNDVERYLMQQAIDQQYALNVSGGSDRFSYYTSIGVDRNRGTAIGNENNRITLRTDNTYRVTKNLSLNAYINYTQARNSNNGFDYMSLLNNAPLYTRLVDDHGMAVSMPYKYRQAYVDTVAYPALLDWHFSPVQELTTKNFRSTNMDVRVGGGLQYTLPYGLRLDVNYQYQRIAHETRNINGENSFYTRDILNRYMGGTPTSVTYPIQRGAIVFYNNNSEKYWQGRAQLNFNRSFGDHQVTALAGMDVSERTVEGMSDNWYGYNEETGLFQTFLNYDQFYPTRPGNSSERIQNGNTLMSNLRRQRSYFANGAYTYANRYTLTLSGRQDGANIFGVKTNQQLSPFWSAGVLWNIGNESFYKFRLVPELKFRATYGFNGNYKNASAFATISYLNNSSTGFPSAQLVGVPNPYLSWEKTRVLNLRLDFSLIGNRVGGSIEWYQKDGIDLVSTVNNDPTSGVATYSGNRATVRGNGVDVQLNSRNLTGALKWNTSMTFSFNTNKVTAFEGKANTGQLLGGGQPYVGRNMWGLYSYKWAGLDDKGRPLGILKDTVALYTVAAGQSGPNPNTMPEDLQYHGTSTPLYSGNLLNTVSYKGFDVSFNITYALDYYFRRSSVNYQNILPLGGPGTYAMSVTHKDYALRWQKAGDEATTTVPAMPAGSDYFLNAFYTSSAILVERGDHIRLRDIRLGYDLGGLRLNKFIKGAHLTAMVSNLGILWKANKQGLDPDYYSREIPAAKSYTIGLQVQF
ncbi:SusC/RagA family TonB-linked outer membrane protein [Paraflavitalea pollutisoli]|uniref:SusC/RagA family TonB-linked outer membrane protein n=1 Tax=Paraflavitalea pollutisoli TaxID=3034143 RepID=UPI0023EBB46E|nr:SusC/RagA family TonB-linked outer membrane protein [Paraflavitalea sp. H1-2-19X]